jgi:pimeloyl-ACP methyl ester carboxylesterase
MAQVSTSPERFIIKVDEGELDDLAVRLAHVRWPPDAPAGWHKGTDPSYLQALLDYWRSRFDWRAQERRLNEYPQFVTDIDGVRIHYLHLRGEGPSPVPLLLTHGWPGSFLEFLPVLPLLVDPGSHGGTPEDAFDVVVPSLPGFAWSQGPPGQEVIRRTPQLWARLMTEALGYDRFGAHGTDIGAFVTNRLALDEPTLLLGAHVTLLPEPALDRSVPLTAAERRFLDERTTVHETAQAYAHVQRTTPVTLAYALSDSPVGLAAWIVEKWRAWSDCDGDIEQRFSKDQLLTNVSLYWFTRSVLSSLHAYADLALATASIAGRDNIYPDAPPGGDGPPLPDGRLVEAPVAVLCGKGYDPPRSWAERAYSDLRRWTKAPRGGHFLASEEPALLAEDLRIFFRDVRTAAIPITR